MKRFSRKDVITLLVGAFLIGMAAGVLAGCYLVEWARASV